MKRHGDGANAIFHPQTLELNRNSPRVSNLGITAEHTTLAAYTHRLIAKQLHLIQKHQTAVLEAIDPEPLHQVRVAMRRLRTALRIFTPILVLPKRLREPILKSFAQRLGSLRDLDVQLLALGQDYRQRLCEFDVQTDLRTFDQIQQSLDKNRQKAFQRVARLLRGKSFLRWHQAWTEWIDQPTFRGLSTIPVQMALPDLFTPGLAHFLLHPAWQISPGLLSAAEAELLHDLRKRCKQVRYQAEFFAEFYPPAYLDWIGQLKTLQDCLGQVQDTVVLKDWLGCGYRESGLCKGQALDTSFMLLQQLVNGDNQTALQEWDHLRQSYLTADFRYELYQLILQPLKI